MTITTSKALLIAAGAFALAGCSHTPGAGTGPLALATPTDDTTVIGKLRIVKNGTEVRLGRGLFANPATLNLVNIETAELSRLAVGKNGEFAGTLADGSYTLSGIDFMVRGERVSVAGDFAFHGPSGILDGYSIVDDCQADCAPMLTRLGLDADAATVALLRPAGQLVTRK